MADIRTLIPSRYYRVVREFVDYDQGLHSVGETWEFVETNFVPCHDGLTLHVLVPGRPLTCRRQAVSAAQEAIIAHFTDHVAPC